MEKIWKEIKGYRGYKYILLCKNGKQDTVRIHRLVAQYFISNPQNKPQVNHIDANKKNNHISNLEWATALENTRHAYKLNLIPTYIRTKLNTAKVSKKVDQFTLEGKFVKRWDSQIEAARSLGKGSGQISGACLGRYKIAHGFIWKFVKN